MSNTSLDDLKNAWNELSQKLDRQNALALSQLRQSKLGAVSLGAPTACGWSDSPTANRRSDHRAVCGILGQPRQHTATVDLRAGVTALRNHVHRVRGARSRVNSADRLRCADHHDSETSRQAARLAHSRSDLVWLHWLSSLAAGTDRGVVSARSTLGSITAQDTVARRQHVGRPGVELLVSAIGALAGEVRPRVEQ
jgi:hypothetical protein